MLAAMNGYGKLVPAAALLVGAGLALAASLAAAPPAAAPPARQSGFALNGNAARGKAVFQERCAICHGDNGNGKSAVAQASTIKPADFTNGPLMAKTSDRDLYRVVQDGGPAVGKSAQMLGFSGILSDAQIRDVVAYVRSLARR
jgi:mono/diheme cytochrome c family protein